MTIAQGYMQLYISAGIPSLARASLRVDPRVTACTDNVFTETWTFSDNSVLTVEHTANPGHQWSAT